MKNLFLLIGIAAGAVLAAGCSHDDKAPLSSDPSFTLTNDVDYQNLVAKVDALDKDNQATKAKVDSVMDAVTNLAQQQNQNTSNIIARIQATSASSPAPMLASPPPSATASVSVTNTSAVTVNDVTYTKTNYYRINLPPTYQTSSVGPVSPAGYVEPVGPAYISPSPYYYGAGYGGGAYGYGQGYDGSTLALNVGFGGQSPFGFARAGYGYRGTGYGQIGYRQNCGRPVCCPRPCPRPVCPNTCYTGGNTRGGSSGGGFGGRRGR